MLAPKGGQSGWIFRDVGIRQLARDLLRPLERLAESGLHDLLLGGSGGLGAAVLPAEPIDPAGGIHETLAAGEVRVTDRAHFDVNGLRRRAGLETVPTGTH